jgi:hypothetical protein
MDVTQWGTDITYNDQYTLVIIKRFKAKALYEVHLHKTHHIIYMKRDNREIVNFTDTYSKDDTSELLILLIARFTVFKLLKKLGLLKINLTPKC